MLIGWLALRRWLPNTPIGVFNASIVKSNSVHGMQGKHVVDLESLTMREPPVARLHEINFRPTDLNDLVEIEPRHDIANPSLSKTGNLERCGGNMWKPITCEAKR